MRAENVTKDPEFVGLRRIALEAETAYYSAKADAEENPTQKNLRRLEKAQRMAEEAAERYVAAATDQGYSL